MKLSADIPEPVLIGYFAKLTMKRVDWPKNPLVEEICSACDCMSRADWDWINEWKHNEMWVFDSPELALSVAPDEQKPKCDVYGYRLYPVRYVHSTRQPFTVPKVSPQPLPNDFEKLGYDLVSRETEAEFGHSPLSCNGLAEEVPTNRHCLLDTAAEAFALVPTLEAPGKPPRGEPGPYHIVEVWRKRRS
jgi:hypothetical protein